MSYTKIPEEQYKKLEFQARGQFGAILNVFRCYGMEAFVDQAIDECMNVTDHFGQAVRGDEKPIHILEKPKARITE